jgi:hypothetical protein
MCRVMSVGTAIPARRIVILGVGVILLAACGKEKSDLNQPEPIPTRTLMPATPTPTSESVSPTPTPTDLPAPSNLSSAPTEASIQLIPPEAQMLVERTLDDLINQNHVNRQDVRLLSLEAFTWPDEAMGCAARHNAGYTRPVTIHGYRILFSAGHRVYVYHAGTDGTFFVCPDPNWSALEGQPLPVDPAARSMVDSTRRDAARQLGVPESDLQLISLLSVTWSDSSLGCPKPDGVYDDQTTPGYRIVFHTQQEQIIYHTSIRDFVRCAPEEEILPGILRQAIPAPTPEQ